MKNCSEQRYFYSLFMVFVVFISSCNISTADSQIVNDFILDGFVPSIPMSYSYDKDSIYLTSIFGKPININSKISPDRFEPGVKNEISNIMFNGVTITIVTPLTGKKRTTWIEYISLTSGKYKLKHGLNIGSDKSEFLKKLGKPRKESGRIFKYQTFGEGHKTLTIKFNSSSKAKEIIWEYFAD